MPKVSVCIPTLNRLAELRRILERIHAQDYDDFEILVRDDASQDETERWLQSMASPRTKVFRNETNKGLGVTLERLFEAASGEYILIQHDHDLPEPSMIGELAGILDRNLAVGLVFSGYHIAYDDGRILRDPVISEYEIFAAEGVIKGSRLIELLSYRTSTPVCAMGAMFRASVVRKAGGYRSEWGLASDEDLYRRVAALSDIAFCPKRLFYLRERPPESRAAMGGWKSILTVYPFREHTARHYLTGSPTRRLSAEVRMKALKWRALLVDAVVLTYRGDTYSLRRAPGDLATLPELGGRRKRVASIGWILFRIVLALGSPASMASGYLRKLFS